MACLNATWLIVTARVRTEPGSRTLAMPRRLRFRANPQIVSRETLRIGQNGVFHVKHAGAAASGMSAGPRSHVRQFHGLGHAFSVLLWDMPNELFHVKHCGSDRMGCFT